MMFVRIVDGKPEVLTRRQWIDEKGGPANVSVPEEINWHMLAGEGYFEHVRDTPPDAGPLQHIVPGALTPEKIEDATGRTIEVVIEQPQPEDPELPPVPPVIEYHPETAVRTRYRQAWVVENLPAPEAQRKISAKLDKVRLGIARRVLASDFTQLADGQAMLTTQQQKDNWANFRTALRGLYNAPDPFNVTWPDVPAGPAAVVAEFNIRLAFLREDR